MSQAVPPLYEEAEKFWRGVVADAERPDRQFHHVRDVIAILFGEIDRLRRDRDVVWLSVGRLSAAVCAANNESVLTAFASKKSTFPGCVYCSMLASSAAN